MLKVKDINDGCLLIFQKKSISLNDIQYGEKRFFLLPFLWNVSNSADLWGKTCFYNSFAAKKPFDNKQTIVCIVQLEL